MPVTWVRATLTRVNPFDDTTETVIEVGGVAVNGVAVGGVSYTFPGGTTDAAIQSFIEAALTAKGYQIS